MKNLTAFIVGGGLVYLYLYLNRKDSASDKNLDKRLGSKVKLSDKNYAENEIKGGFVGKPEILSSGECATKYSESYLETIIPKYNNRGEMLTAFNLNDLSLGQSLGRLQRNFNASKSATVSPNRVRVICK